MPQGSVLGLLLFLVYINEAKHLLSLTRLFADDSSLIFYSAAHIADIVVISKHDLQLLTITGLNNGWLHLIH